MDPTKILCIIPARGGSKRIPGKNLRVLSGEPLLVHTLDHALGAELVGKVVVSTDSEKIATVARGRSVEVIWRPSEISGDDSPSEAAILHVLDTLSERDNYEPDTVVFLQCTAPIRTSTDIDRAIRKFVHDEADSLLSVVEAKMFLWTERDGRPEPLNYPLSSRPRSQEMPPIFIENGSIYIFKPNVLLKGGGRLGGKIVFFIMGRSSMIDIDEPMDLALCEFMLSRETSP